MEDLSAEEAQAVEADMMEDEEIYEEDILEALTEALNFPHPSTVWDHDDMTWTRSDLARRFRVGEQSATSHAEQAVEEGNLIKGRVRGDRGHFIVAYRFPDHPALEEGDPTT